jgi:predicted transcriptional regulator
MCDIVIMGKRTSDKKTEFLSVRVPASTKSELLRIAEKNERSLSWVVAKILALYLTEERKGDLGP